MRFDTVLIDVDDTLFDFRKSSFEALVKAFAEIGVTFTEEDMLKYEVFNDQMWKSYELGEIEKDFIYAERFRRYFASIGLDADPVAINRRYLLELAEGRNFMPHCKELLQALHGKYLVVVVTNGDTYAQERRIERSGMAQYFDYVFISEQLGTKKPEKDFYDKVFAQIGEDRRKSAIMVGDSLSSDMQGGRNAGIPTCFYGTRLCDRRSSRSSSDTGRQLNIRKPVRTCGLAFQRFYPILAPIFDKCVGVDAHIDPAV